VTAPQLTQALNLFVGTSETLIGTPTLQTDSAISQDSFRRVVLCVTSHSSLTESLRAYTSVSTISRNQKDAEMRTTLKTLPPYVIFHLEVTTFCFQYYYSYSYILLLLLSLEHQRATFDHSTPPEEPMGLGKLRNQDKEKKEQEKTQKVATQFTFEEQVDLGAYLTTPEPGQEARPSTFLLFSPFFCPY